MIFLLLASDTVAIFINQVLYTRFLVIVILLLYDRYVLKGGIKIHSKKVLTIQRKEKHVNNIQARVHTCASVFAT